MIVLADPSVAAQPVAEGGEPLVDLRAVTGLAVDPRLSDRPGFCLVRAGIADRLVAAESRLPPGFRLLVVEGYRNLRGQQSLYEEYRAQLAGRHPGWGPGRLADETSKFVSPLDVAPHVTGGAVDLTLLGPDGAELDLGTEIDATPDATDDATFTDAASICEQARQNRRLLSAAMRGAGMVNYPSEWWHWSYGDRYWSLLSSAGQAVYGPVDAPARHGSGPIDPAATGPARTGAGSAGNQPDEEER
jgi:D-alanyl-D-alanine dipeptidase